VLAGVQAYVPLDYDESRPAALIVMLHGAGGDALQALALAIPVADRYNAIVLAPKSHRATWDVVHGLGPDVEMIDRALAAAFDTYAVDPEHVAVGGFSDGASYALTLGLANGDLFKTIVAFSPGFEAAPVRTGKPKVFISHGTRDRVLQIDRTSRRLATVLRTRGLDLDYVEFDGTHSVPSDVVERGFARWLA
jgi:predicted esterase